MTEKKKPTIKQLVVATGGDSYEGISSMLWALDVEGRIWYHDYTTEAWRLDDDPWIYRKS